MSRNIFCKATHPMFSIVQNVFSCPDSRCRFVSSFRKSNDNQRSRLSPDYIWDWLVELFVREIFARTSNHWKSAHPCYINPFLSTDSLFLLFFVPFSPFGKITDSLHAINRYKEIYDSYGNNMIIIGIKYIGNGLEYW